MLQASYKEVSNFLKDLFTEPARINVMSVDMLSGKKLLHDMQKHNSEKVIVVFIDYSGFCSGSSVTIFHCEHYCSLIDQAKNSDGEQIENDVCYELTNTLVNRILGTIGNLINRPFDFTFPRHMITSTGFSEIPEINNFRDKLLFTRSVLKVGQVQIQVEMAVSVEDQLLTKLLAVV